MSTNPVVPSLLMASSYLNVGFYTLELVLCRRYFKRPNRPLLYKSGVAALIFFDTVCTLTICVNVIFFVLGIPLGTMVASLSPTSVIIFMTYCTAAVEQAILCHLFHSLTKNVFISTVLASLILIHMGFAFASGALILVLDSEVSAALTIATVTSITCAATDILIAICLGCKVWKMLSPVDMMTPADSFVRKFFLLIVSSGLIVAANTLLGMGLLLKDSPGFGFFCFCQGRVYSLTLLVNFLVGVHFLRETSTDTVSTRSQRGPSMITGVDFDVIAGYDTDRGSQDMRRSGVNAGESKSPAPSHRPIPLNAVRRAQDPLLPPFSNAPQNLGTESMRPEHRPSLRVRSEPSLKSSPSFEMLGNTNGHHGSL
ncbi:hypothetical protein B0H17DRAFT_1097782 [Mycena rosella]|uniref:Uncharacterized protein n=1 Tax=Mycena rosella TaxID=1033263 RepID=A0AAD7CSA4_MYCRO|nr:hypothetical protein B0H17DRAFT_1097782 [Mycena rosella]